MKEIKMIVDDKRKIEGISFQDDTGFYIKEKHIHDIEEILPYYENGEPEPIVWFAIIQNGQVSHRVNSKHIAVVNYGINKLNQGTPK